MKTVILFTLVWFMVGQTNGASFYGDGFVQLRAVEASSRNALHVRFRTSSSSGLLFLAAGQTDYLTVELHAGRLEVKLDLGAGERVLLSDKGSQLNDLAWHTLELLHERYNVTLTVDKHAHTRVKMPRPEQELSVQDGLFVGGSGGLDKLYLPGDQTGFRGCVDEVIFNEHNLLSSLRPYSGLKNVHEVSLGCSPQFLATEFDPISFFSSRAYVSLQSWTAQQEWVFECSVHTSANEGIVLYNSARQGDFVALEIQEGLLVAIVGRGGSKTELHSLTFVNDKKWHYMKLYFTAKSLQLTVDKEMVKTSIAARSKSFQLKGPMFVGGVDDSTRSELRKIGLVSVSGKRVRGGSFKGCLRDIKVNQTSVGLPQALVTKDISVGCEPEREPEMTTTATSPTTLLASVTQTPPVHMSTLAKGLVKKYGHNFLVLRDLVVPEGGRGSLESKHIKVNLDFKKLGVRQSQIMFRIEEQPVHGQLRLDVDEEQEENTFGMLDLWHGRVMYIHGGAEDPQDFFMFSIFSSSRKEVPSYLKGKKMHRFNITVTPTNDAPELSLPEGNLFSLLEDSRKPLTTEVLRATDIDSDRADLVYSVLGKLNADAGFLEDEDNPGQVVTSFPHTALEEGKINYVHTGVKNSRIVLRVSDGEKVSNTVVLRVLAVPLEYKITNNTGVKVTQGETVMIGTRQLAVQTNAVKQLVDIRYDITEPTRFGELQRLHSSGEWKHTSSFSQRLLDKERLRYVSTFQEIQAEDVSDLFKCTVTVATRATEELVFPIKVKWIRYDIVRNDRLEMDKIRRVVIDSEYLYVEGQGLTIPEDELSFRVLSPPNKGKLLLNNVVLGENSTFSQTNVTDGKVEYQLVDRPYEDTNDTFTFHVFTKHSYSASHNFTLGIMADVNSIFLKNEGLSLLEGESKLITKEELFAETLSTKEMYYTIKKGPKHGRLTRINTSNSTSDNSNMATFSNEDILGERLIYIHDDSETTDDYFTFVASTSLTPDPSSSEEDDYVTPKEGSFNISIQLVNDEKPVRIVDKVFHVVRDGQRLLTLDDLCFHDADSDFSDGQLVYTRRGIPMGELVMANDTSRRLHQFRQEDLEQKRVLFTHRGVSSGRFVLFVSDGKHYVSTLLDISAHDPYLRVGNNTGLLVQKGRERALNTTALSVLTNLDIRGDDEVTFIVKEAPKHGGLFWNGTRVTVFTQAELKQGLVAYRHDDSKNMVDSFAIKVKAKDMVVDANVKVKVYLESHQRPPVILKNKPLLVEEGKPVKIERSTFEVSHEDNLPSEIMLMITAGPSHGYLRRFVEGEERYMGTEDNPVKSFTQEDINDGNLQYVHLGDGHLDDTLTLQASNGVTEVNNITVSVDVIPSLIPLDVSNFTLKEGASKALTDQVLQVTNRHYEGLNFQFSVTGGPQHGHIEHSRFPGTKLSSFTRREVEQEFIYYVHDGSETLDDRFTVTANDTDLRKHSTPRTLFVEVTPVNDQPPVVTANRVLRVWVGSVTEITTSDLNAEDEDSPAEDLIFMVTQPSNGHLALKSAPTRPLMNFTQAHIQQGQLLFVHSGAMAGGFNFQVNDGVNFAPRQIFSITARALVISLVKNGPLKVFPGSTTAISKEDLQAVTNDKSGTSNRTIVYTVTSPPRLGKLVAQQSDNSTEDISSFTQAMVDKGVVLYEQKSVDRVGWTALDTLSFSVSSPPTSLEAQTFNIDISYENIGPSHNSLLLKNTGAVVTEGDKVVIDKSKLDGSNLITKRPESQRQSYEVWYQVTKLPQHGFIVVGERNVTKEKPNFSQFILNKYGITYHHDNSESTSDRFVFDVFLNLKSKPTQRPLDDDEVVQESFNITVTPINDQPPVLKTKAPSLKVVQGDMAVLGPGNLNVVDLDNPPEEIRYTVISQPNNGFLAMEGKLNVSVQTFTQAQINNGQLYFIQDGSPASGVFYFSVTDGHHRPVYKLFNLEVTEITVSLVNNSLVLLEQGETTATITSAQLAAETNGKNTTIRYRVTESPRYGKLLLDDILSSSFSQEDLQAERLVYHMLESTSSTDSFEFIAFTSEANLTGQVVNISVTPRVKFVERLQVPNGVQFKLKTRFLNATRLAALSGSDPIFEILAHPKCGKLVRATKHGKRATPLESFTSRDLEQEKVAIDVKANLTGIQELNDSLVFVLKADTVPPARGELMFTVVPYSPVLFTTTGSPVPTVLNHTSAAVGPGMALSLSTLALGITATQRQSTRLLPKNRGRDRWGNQNQNRTDPAAASTVPRPPLEKPDMAPVRNTPVRVESYPQKSSNPLLVILPVLACLLLVVILLMFIIYLRKKKKQQQQQQQKTLKRSDAAASLTASPCPPSPAAQSERSAAIPTVTVTPLSPSCPSSPMSERPHGASDASLPLCSWGGTDAEAEQLCRTPKPTLQRNQYWV
ncbi:hypothetical protein AALO_G00063990 [Alosa alosa]|uniref:Laminin G domain-containing protein n=1 Tax=Alosa alosa TaxID=278164 RepID=A0AAV6H152_9TELE|nr:chondroitin sulfate proteoglycan 4 [Alosa alosa]KAG5280784.1 hypothetical protein AALO_G00063990 [Alosa alosa]